MRCLVILTALFSSLAFGQIESVINFNGQNADTVKIDKAVSLVRKVQVEVPSTCTRQVPYETYECRDVTFYREECSWVPASQQCWDEPEQVCRTVLRTREECSNGPSRRVCNDIPTRQVCTDRPSREVCTDRPSREVCRKKPDGSQSCTTVGGGRSCQTVGGGQSCQTVGGGQSCHDVEGPRICRDVSYNDQECSTVHNRQCRDIPGHNDCRDIPYSEEVCGNETRYNTESYACTRTEIQVQTVVKQLKGDINVKFLTNGLVEEFPLAIVLNGSHEKNAKYSLAVSLKKEPKVLVIKRKAKVDDKESEKEIALEGEMTIEVLEAKMVAPSFPEEFSSVSLNEDTRVLALTIKGQISARGKIDLSLTRKGWFLGRKAVVAEVKVDYPSEKAKIEGDKLLVDLSSDLYGKVNKLLLNLKLSTDLSIDGEILNTKKPSTEKSYEGLGVTLE